MLAALKAIAQLPGNLPDDTLTDRTGPNDARQRGLMVAEARRIATVATTKIEPAPTALAETAEREHKAAHYFLEVDWRDCPQEPCPERYRVVRPEQEVDRLRKE